MAHNSCPGREGAAAVGGFVERTGKSAVEEGLHEKNLNLNRGFYVPIYIFKK
jgi:hypothetical protein